MPRILRLPEAEGGQPAAPEAPATDRVPQADFLADPERFTGRGVTVQVKPGDRVDALGPHLAHVSGVAIEFPGPGEGRGYTFARLLRQLYGYKGEIRAVGPAVKQDLLFFMVRCGFDAFDMAEGENLAEAQQALHRFTLAYQPAVPRVAVREVRFTAATGT